MYNAYLDEDTGIGTVTLSRNSSLSWRGNMLFFGAMFALSLLIAIFFLVLGAWPILPFAGLELAVLAVCIYQTALRGENKEVLCLGEDALVLQRGRNAAQEEQSFPRADVFFDLRVPSSRLDKICLLLRSGDIAIEIGGQLADAEKQGLLELLREQQLRWHNKDIRWLRQSAN